MIATTKEQAEHLLQLGLPAETADMMWVGTNWGDTYLVGLTDDAPPMMEDDIPAWSLSALLEVMPRPDLYREVADLWVCATFFKEGSVRGFGQTAIEAACDTIAKMFKLGYLKKKGGQDESKN